VCDVLCSEEKAYVVGTGGSLCIVDITDPALPRTISQFDFAGTGESVAMHGNLLFIATGTRGVIAVDVSDPINPVDAGFFETGRDAQGIASVDNTVFVADADNGVYVLEYGTVSGEKSKVSPSAIQIEAYPNPCSDKTMLRFTLDTPDYVDIRLYDMYGRCVRSEPAEQRSAGTQLVLLDTRDLAAGLFMCSVATPGGEKSVNRIIRIP